MHDILIKASKMQKTFHTTKGEEVHAVDGLSLQVQAGEIYGLVGADGAGKTTAIRLLIGALKLDSGRVTIAGFPIDRQLEQARSQVGYLSQRFSLYDDLTVMENIRFFAEVRGLSSNEWLPRCEENLEFVNLSPFKDRLAGQLSGGMKQKLGLATALVSRPRIVLMDEPTSALDLVRQYEALEALRSYAEETGAVMFLALHDLNQVIRCCSSSVALAEAHVIATGPTMEVLTPQLIRRLYALSSWQS